MARKDRLSKVFSAELSGVARDKLPDGNPAKDKPPPFGLNRDAAEHLKKPDAKSIQDIAADLIREGGPQDRMEPKDTEADAALRESIAKTGQTTPVLLRPDPSEPGYFRIIFGRRRVRALRALGRPVQAIVRDDISDNDAVVIQGQENSVRKDLSFLERARFLVAIEREGFARSVAIDALAIDKARASNYAKLGSTLPDSIAHRIGPAPGIGRTRWLDFVTAYDALPDAAARIETALAGIEPDVPSDDRFRRAMAALKPSQPAKSPSKRQIIDPHGKTVLATVTRGAGTLQVSIPAKGDAQKSFAAYLDQRIEALIHEELDRWQKTGGQEARPAGKETR